MLLKSISFVFVVAYFALYGIAEELSNGYINPTNRSTGANVPLFSVEADQSDIWLLTKDSPIPARLNRAWSPETGYPGVQHISTLRRTSYEPQLRGTQSSVDILENRNENIQVNEDLFVYAPESSNDQHPEAILVQLPAELTSGLWEDPRPQFMRQLTAKGRRIGTPQTLDLIHFDDGVNNNGPQSALDIAIPTTEALDRLPLSTFGPLNENAAEPIHELTPNPFFIASDRTNNGTISPVSISSSNQQDAWYAAQRRDATPPTIEIPEKGRNLLFDISYDDLSSTSTSGSFGLTLTKDDIEILEKLGILSSLNLESFELQNKTDSLKKNSQNVKSDPQLILQENQHFSRVSDKKDNGNNTDFVFLEIPEFLTSHYHGNIPGTDEESISTQAIPFILSDEELLPMENKSEIKQNLTETRIFNASSLTLEHIDDIFELLSSSVRNNFNYSSSQPITAILDEVPAKTLKNEVITKALKPQLTTANPLVFNLNNVSDITTSMSTSISRNSLAAPGNYTTNIENPQYSQGLVSSGRIQPRLLDSNRSSTENEILQMISSRISPTSSEKLELVKKLKMQPRPYVFGFNQDDGNGTHQHRNETADGSGVVKGTYGYRDAFGVYRNVNYIADNNGFHAVVRTNEPGTISTSTADAVYKAELPPQAAVAQMMAYARAKVKKANNS